MHLSFNGALCGILNSNSFSIDKGSSVVLIPMEDSMCHMRSVRRYFALPGHLNGDAQLLVTESYFSQIPMGSSER